MAAAGEANQLTIAKDAQGGYTITDVVPIKAPKACAAIAGGVRCASSGTTYVVGITSVKLGDGDDSATVEVETPKGVKAFKVLKLLT